MGPQTVSATDYLKHAAVSLAIWIGVFLLAEGAISIVTADIVTIAVGGAFVASVNQHRRVRKRRSFPTIRRPKSPV